MRGTRSATSLGVMLVGLGLYVAVGYGIGDSRARADSPSAKPDAVAVGAEIFHREWMPNDPRSHGGDGLGPVYNDTSCVACHNSGGSGGGGPVGKNIDILSASNNGGVAVQQPPAQGGSASPSAAAMLDPLAEVHAGFRTTRTVVLHKFGTDPNYGSWRSRALNTNAPAGNPTNVVAFTNADQVFIGQAGGGGFGIITQMQGGRRRSAEDPAASRAAERMMQIR
ncbi:MAG TPA: di-heme oxidoredictase family protein, partial [Isosphaeraceae bacterium]|nr:di-heme oxidoredictase family protein [Isosphaeraceae bacterium]